MQTCAKLACAYFEVSALISYWNTALEIGLDTFYNDSS